VGVEVRGNLCGVKEEEAVLDLTRYAASNEFNRRGKEAAFKGLRREEEKEAFCPPDNS
jgi:hypothetical protein